MHDFGDEITFQTNVDGLPLFKSSNSQFWPIFGLMDKDPERKPFFNWALSWNKQTKKCSRVPIYFR